MSNIRQALETHLSQIANPLPTQWQNVAFTPTNGVPYQMAHIMFAEPDDYTISRADKYLEQGFLQITLKYPTNQGVTVLEDKARELRKHFKRGTILTNDDDLLEVIDVEIGKTPTIKQLGVEGDRYLVAVTVYWYCKLKD